nr:Chain A, Stimulator of interferon genes protein [Stylophora pistillata]8EFN_D Chain D, Stimulator of interferon genes protein [Stylophora pistillata]
NVADGFAWNYYFGYLKLVLPRLEAQIAKSSEFRYKITKKKLYILVPKTCYVYDNIADADPRVTWAGDLTPCKINRGGIKERIYKQAVYRVAMTDKHEYFFILEYASNLMSLYDMSLHEDAPLSRQERDDQVVLFIRKLREILEGCKECRGKCEIVPISGDEKSKIADVLVAIHNATQVESDEADL